MGNQDTYVPSSHDGDQIWDGWEFLHHMWPYSGTSLGTSSNLAYKGADPASGLIGNGPDYVDSELLADLHAAHAVFSSMNAWQGDWDYQQGVNNHQPYFAQNKPFQQQGDPPNKPPVFYLKFLPLVTGYPTNGDTPFIENGGPLPDRSYPIRSLQDLQVQYSRLLISLPGLYIPQ